jgi:hypothetical protein
VLGVSRLLGRPRFRRMGIVTGTIVPPWRVGVVQWVRWFQPFGVGIVVIERYAGTNGPPLRFSGGRRVRPFRVGVVLIERCYAQKSHSFVFIHITKIGFVRVFMTVVKYRSIVLCSNKIEDIIKYRSCLLPYDICIIIVCSNHTTFRGVRRCFDRHRNLVMERSRVVVPREIMQPLCCQPLYCLTIECPRSCRSAVVKLLLYVLF